MLVDKKDTYQAGEVITFKLTNGDELIAGLVSVDDHSYTVSSPVRLALLSQHDSMTRPTLSADWHRMVIPRNQVAIHGRTNQEYQIRYQEYVSATTK